MFWEPTGRWALARLGTRWARWPVIGQLGEYGEYGEYGEALFIAAMQRMSDELDAQAGRP